MLVMNSISQLLNNLEYFSGMASKVDLRDYEFTEIDSFKYPVGVSYLSVNKSYVHDYQQAFSVLFVKWLYCEHEWDIHELLEEEQWCEILKTIWIPRYLRKVNLKPYMALNFINEAAVWLEHNGFPHKQIELFQAQHKEGNVIEVKDVYACHHCFGETEDVYFLCEFGCGYD
jgi:hypothetical protein